MLGLTDVSFISVCMCWTSKFHSFEVFLFLFSVCGIKVETDISSHRLMRITNASYDEITVNKIQIENEIGLATQVRSMNFKRQI